MSEGQAAVEANGNGSSTGWLRVRRIFASLLTVAATVYVGIGLAHYLALAVIDCKIQEVAGIRVEWGLTAVGLSYLFASLEKVLKLANVFREYITKPDKKIALYPECVALACIVAYLGLTSLAFSANKECGKPPPTALVSRDVVYLSRLAPASTPPLEYVPFFFADLAGGEKDPDKGTTLSPQQVSDLGTLVKSLKACAGMSRGQDVELDVRGYADPNEFPSNSGEQNRRAANRRAANLHRQVKDMLGSSSGLSNVVLRDLKEWPETDPSAMTRERYFETLPMKETGKERDQGLFNRRADLLVLRLGACERMRELTR